jgi:glycerol-3-phosphate cytidylyltransferase-like family protein
MVQSPIIIHGQTEVVSKRGVLILLRKERLRVTNLFKYTMEAVNKAARSFTNDFLYLR